jgi:hypothetical protein
MSGTDEGCLFAKFLNMEMHEEKERKNVKEKRIKGKRRKI